jgi:hypothetical protein
MSGRTPPPAGWYDDPKMVDTRRYWDGFKWTEHRQEKPADPPPAGPFENDGAPSGWVTFGYLFAVFFPVVGLIIGISRIGIEPKWAWKIIGISLASFLVYALLYVYNR